jgi:hypothetical protein
MKKHDLYGEAIALMTDDDSDKINSKCGGCLSIFTVLLLLAILINKLYSGIYRQNGANVQIEEQKKYYWDNDIEFSVGPSSYFMTLAFGLTVTGENDR